MTAVAVVPIAREKAPLKELAVGLFGELRRLTGDGVGITRECYGEGEDRALALFREVAEAEGLWCQVDAGANLIVSLAHDDGAKPALILGSHADSVPQGGNYDGAAGIVAGLLCLIRMQRENVRPAVPVRLLAMRGEESAFYGRANIGSRVLFGRLDPKDLDAKQRGTGRTLREAMAATGIDVSRVERGEQLFNPAQAYAYLELHIEQGPVMIARDLPTAVVTGIRGSLRHRKVVCHGEAGHSGAVPRWLRHDAVFAVADLLMRLDEHWDTLLARGLDLVVTAGIIGTDPNEHAITRIPGEAHFSLDIRSQSRDTLEAFYELVRSECRAVGKQRRVSFTFDDRVYAEPARMDEGIIGSLLKASAALGLPTEAVASGAGHDAAVFANEGIRSGMIFVRNAHGSHNPKEDMDIADFMKGVDLMYAVASSGL